MVIAILLAIPLGIVSAIKRNSLVDRLAMLLAVVGQSVPNFWLGIMLIFLFAVTLHWLPSSGKGSWRHILMPACARRVPLARLARSTEAGMREVLAEDYIQTARAKGLSERWVIIRHALRNTAIPLITVIGLQVGALLGGAVVIESIFAWPGVGQLVIQAIQARDFPLVQAAVFFVAVVFVFVNLTVDVLYGLIDPRIQH